MPSEGGGMWKDWSVKWGKGRGKKRSNRSGGMVTLKQEEQKGKRLDTYGKRRGSTSVNELCITNTEDMDDLIISQQPICTCSNK